MHWLKRKRVKQVLQYGWKDAKSITQMNNKSRLLNFFDIIRCFCVYYVFSNQYCSNKIWAQDGEDAKKLMIHIGNNNLIRDNWWIDYYENRRFLNKFKKYFWEVSPKRQLKRISAYRKRYAIGKNCKIQYDVEFSRTHELQGTLKIGDNCLLAKHVFVDYSGNVTIGNNVQLTNGVVIETHYHPGHSELGFDIEKAVPTNLVIGDGAVIGSKAIILASCNYIGKYARVGAGAVVTHDVPDFTIVVGVPAKIVRVMNVNNA